MAFFFTPQNNCLRLRNHRFLAGFHSSASVQGSQKPRSRLAKSLQPETNRGTLEVASFERSSPPHHGRAERKPVDPGVVSFRRLARRDAVLSETGKPTWNKESPRFNKEKPAQTNEVGKSEDRPEYRKEKNMDYDASAESEEFYNPPVLVTTGGSTEIAATLKGAPGRFNSPPLLPGFVTALKEMLGPDVRPTPIQSLSMKWLFDENPAFEYNQFLLASETGSGKSIAYLLPLLQNIKKAEEAAAAAGQAPKPSSRPLNPRGIILAPTHELSRQLSLFAKSLLHDVKLRVMCASRANTKTGKSKDVSASEMAAQFDNLMKGGDGEFSVSKDPHPVDLVVGTPMKIMEMIKGRGWDRKEIQEGEEVDPSSLRRGRDKMVGFGKWKSKPELGLENVEWVIVDEADVLLDPDFQEVTRSLLADISEARGHPVTLDPFPTSAAEKLPEDKEVEYPFNLVLTSATIPSSLARYLDAYHPRLIRLASPRLHHLPKTLQTEYVGWTGGNKNADIEKRVRKVWAEDALSVATSETPVTSLSKILVFCNKSSKVVELSAYLSEKGIKNVALTSAGEERRRGSNKHLDGFLRPIRSSCSSAPSRTPSPPATPVEPLAPGMLSDPSKDAHVMITTSLLSRGLDFDPSIKHVFIVDEPRNMIDFLHRAGRSGRAGQAGRVVIFGKTKGRGSDKARDVKQRVRALV
ncbi:RNA helicase [Ephemerocybe angulata]|uniref:RNA helicase n=1 Tax=Ephemerocybe angulata TaxID=980116 RepID=A0A8H6HUH4_9AGAR|nr:RNA helicase [Tulosesus angulatus]